jgi:glutamate-1-semialdehyde aminotransferase/spore coat polysaccharide biosynthesis protein SpsF (cytidylyltransferase family)
VKVVAIIQARMGSTRLPGKVLMDLDGIPVLEWVVRACNAAPGVDDVWVATSTLDADDAIEAFCSRIGVLCYRGSETDVLDRIWRCAALAGADVTLRITGDCPFVDPQVIGGVVRLIRQNPKLAYASNVSPRTYPDGLDVQAMSWAALDAARAEATRPIDRDCVTTFIERNRSRFPSETLINPVPGMAGERWVLDTEADLAFCRAVAEHWWIDAADWNRCPSYLDILTVLDTHPDLRALNAGHVMNERYFEALAEEPIYERTYTRSQEAFARAKEVIPLGAQTFSKSHLQFPQPSPLFLSHGEGALAWDVDGNEYVDLVSALLPNILGYRDPDVDAAIRHQLCAGISFSLATELEAKLAETLCRLIPCAEAARFGKTGTDVTTAAIRVARAYTGRDQVLIVGGYHGWADWSVERNLGVPEDVQALTTRVARHQVPTNLEDYAAVIIEPEEGPAYLASLRQLCHRDGALLIFDEVITGFRFDLGGAQKLYNVTPDLACFGKAMANGMPLSAIVGRKDVMAKFAPPDNIFYSGTFFGETLSLAAGIATIKKLERDNLLTCVRALGSALALKVGDLARKMNVMGEISLYGHSSYKRIAFADNDIAALFRREMIKTGTLIIASHNISAAHDFMTEKRVLKSYEHTFGVIREAMDKGNIKEMLAGASVGPMVRAR